VSEVERSVIADWESRLDSQIAVGRGNVIQRAAKYDPTRHEQPITTASAPIAAVCNLLLIAILAAQHLWCRAGARCRSVTHRDRQTRGP